MAIYAVGDVQGCYGPFRRLLDSVRFDPDNDRLWSVGDLVNRGPDSLEVLRFCRSLGDNFICTLGNHDLHFLARAHGHSGPKAGDTLKPLLKAPDLPELVQWLKRQKLFHYDATLGYAMVHAGVHPGWGVRKALRRAAEIESVLQSNQVDTYFAKMYGNTPSLWKRSLSGPARWRVITNYFTRMRFCDKDGRLEFRTKTGIGTAPKGYMPWYEVPKRKMASTPLIFGHWAALQGKIEQPNLFALDTGCVWGGSLTLMNLSDGQNSQTSVRP